MMAGEAVITVTDIQARVESMGTDTLASKGFSETLHSTAFSVDSMNIIVICEIT